MVESSRTFAPHLDCLAWPSAPGFGRRRRPARAAAALPSSLDFSQGTFEKICFQHFLAQHELQFADLFSYHMNSSNSVFGEEDTMEIPASMLRFLCRFLRAADFSLVLVGGLPNLSIPLHADVVFTNLMG